MKRRRIIWLVGALLVGWLAWALVDAFRGAHGAPQLVALSDGTKARFGGATWGTNQIPPFLAERLTYSLPAALSKFVQNKYGTRFGLVPAWPSDEPNLAVWMDLSRTPVSSMGTVTALHTFLADENGVEGGLPYTYLGGSYPWQSATFTIVPRRSRMIEVHFYRNDGYTKPRSSMAGSVRFRNPLYGRFPEWQPEPLPASKLAGDIQVTLTSCTVGNRWESRFATSFGLDLRQPPATNEHWVICEIEASDATGNRTSSQQFYVLDGGSEASVPTVFWPAEKAIRLKVWVKRTAGFASNEVITVTNLPVPKANATNGVTLTNMVGGHKLLLWNFAKPAAPTTGPPRVYTGPPVGPYEVDLALPDHPSDVIAEWRKVETDTGENFMIFGSGPTPEGQARYYNSMPADATYLNVTISVQKMRTVEFLVKPPVLK